MTPPLTPAGTAQPRTPTSRQARQQVLPMAILFVFAVYFLAPLVWLLFSVTKTQTDFSGTFGFWFSGKFQLVTNVGDVLSKNNHIFARWLLNTAIYSVSSALGATLLASMAGYALAKFTFRGREAYFLTILGSLMVPVTALALPLYLLMSDANLGIVHVSLINNYLSVILPSLVSPFGVYLMRVYIAGSVSDDLLNAARIDGANEANIFFRIVLRLATPGLVTVLLFTFVGTWNNYFLPFVVLSDQTMYPLSVGLAFWNGLTNQPGINNVTNVQVITGAMISVLPLVVAFIFLQRYWNNSLTLGTSAG